MIYLLDTDLLIFMIRGLKTQRRAADYRRATDLVDCCRKAKADGNDVGISAVTVSELEFGARRSGNYDAEIAAVEKILTPFELYAYDARSAPRHYGHLRHALETKGVAIGSMDTLIAAHALALNATLVTNNKAHFSRVRGLNMVNWLEPS